MSQIIRAFAALEPSSALLVQELRVAELKAEEVEVEVEYCGLCHSDVSMAENEWGFTRYPFVGGHEVVGRIASVGANVKALRVGDRVGIGWTASSCGECQFCLAGDPIFCAKSQGTIVGRHGGFAERVRCHWMWAVKLPGALDPALVGPMFCGGITVFNPFLEFGILPIHRVAVLGIGGLGHLALKFARAWGCEVTAITSNASKSEQLMAMGAHQVLVGDAARGFDMKKAGSFDFILSTINVATAWSSLLQLLAPRGHLVLLGATMEAIPVQAMQLLGGRKAVVGNGTGSPTAMAKMLEFCSRHMIAPTVEQFAMSDINAAIAHLKRGDARYRVVLKNDFA